MENFQKKQIQCKSCGKTSRLWIESKAYIFKLCGATNECETELFKAIREENNG